MGSIVGRRPSGRRVDARIVGAMSAEQADLSILRPFTLDQVSRYLEFLRRNDANDVADAVEDALRLELDAVVAGWGSLHYDPHQLRLIYTATQGRQMHDPVSQAYLLQRAQQVRERAESIGSDEVRKALLDLAQTFDVRAAAAALHWDHSGEGRVG